MRYEILTHFFGQHVEVWAASKTFSGIIRQAEVDGGTNDVIEIEPVGEYQRKHYGSMILDIEMIKSIKSVKPYDRYSEDELKSDMSEDECCEDVGL